MGQALYRSHRPKKLGEVVGQEHVTTALERSLKKGTIAHAYLLTGPRGTGKTSIARILAHEINGLPYTDDAIHLDIIEIDAASNRRIDEIRDLRDKVHIAPTSAKYKVYIIDEVHMLTKEAFNALLKTLEEPPAHVVFILATTEAHKLPETIISRTQRFSVKPVDLQKVTAHLKSIADQEKISIDSEALELIAAHGEGSFRDSISLLDQARNTADKITLADVQSLLGIAPKKLINSLLDAVSSHDTGATVEALKTMHSSGYEPAQTARQLAAALRAELLDGKPRLERSLLLNLLADLINVQVSADPKSYLEISLLDAALNGTPAPAPAAAKVMPEEIQNKPPVIVEPHPSSVLRKPVEAEPAPELQPKQTPAADGPVSDAVLNLDAWAHILAATKAKHNTLFSIVNVTTPHFETGQITLECGYAFHQKRLNENRNKEMLADIIKQVTGQDIRIQCVMGQPTEPGKIAPAAAVLPPADEQVHSVGAETPAPAPETPAIKTISNIFGGAELLQS